MEAKVIAHANFVISRIDNRIYGSFIEHLGRAIYTGIYEPTHEQVDGQGMRLDVANLVRGLNVPVIRYPGGNFVSAYNWEDGVGPRDLRPVRLDLAWHTSETNEVGLHEFAEWCESVGSEMMLAVNLGSRGVSDARNILEYSNHPSGSYWSDLRIKNGRIAPFNVKVWYLGNELDGPWQIGGKTAEEYGRLAHETAKAMRAYDRSLELIVCGSSNPRMPTYPEWEATVLEHTYDDIDYVSLHMYFGNQVDDTPAYLAMNYKMDAYITAVEGVINYIKAKKRTDKNVYISFDEWNVWYHSRPQDKATLDGNNGWPVAPPIFEDIYNFEDLLQVALVINTLIRRSNIVRIACLAQLVNVIAPIMTEPGGAAWRQTIYYPFEFASRFGRGKALDLNVNSPTYTCSNGEAVSSIDIAAVYNEEVKEIAFFIVNRCQDNVAVTIDLQGFGTDLSIIDYQVISDFGLKQRNAGGANNIYPRPCKDACLELSTIRISTGSYSYHMVRVGHSSKRCSAQTS